MSSAYKILLKKSTNRIVKSYSILKVLWIETSVLNNFSKWIAYFVNLMALLNNSFSFCILLESILSYNWHF